MRCGRCLSIPAQGLVGVVDGAFKGEQYSLSLSLFVNVVEGDDDDDDDCSRRETAQRTKEKIDRTRQSTTEFYQLRALVVKRIPWCPSPRCLVVLFCFSCSCCGVRRRRRQSSSCCFSLSLPWPMWCSSRGGAADSTKGRSVRAHRPRPS